MTNDLLSIILEDEKLFEFYSMQSGLGDFLRHEKFLREKREKEIKVLIEREAHRKK